MFIVIFYFHQCLISTSLNSTRSTKEIGSCFNISLSFLFSKHQQILHNAVQLIIFNASATFREISTLFSKSHAQLAAYYTGLSIERTALESFCFSLLQFLLSLSNRLDAKLPFQRWNSLWATCAGCFLPIDSTHLILCGLVGCLAWSATRLEITRLEFGSEIPLSFLFTLRFCMLTVDLRE